jgi:PleD family two-component response regulator
VLIDDPVTRDATRRALDDVARWLGASQCAQLFSEFHTSTVSLSVLDFPLPSPDPLTTCTSFTSRWRGQPDG